MHEHQRDLALTFAGGGNRAFYQLGLLREWGSWLLPRTAGVAACSAGAYVICLYIAGREQEAWDFWFEARAHVKRNFTFANALKGKPIAPHVEVYPATIRAMLAGGGFEKIQAAPFPILVLTAGFPRALPGPVAVALGLAGYQAEKAVAPTRIHPKLGRSLGFRPVVADARACRSIDELTDLLVASGSTPPVTPLGRFRGESLLDGGLVDNVPAFVGDDIPGATRNLVLLTRAYPDTAPQFERGKRLYLAPTHPVPVHRWDYTRPDLLEATIAMGAREAAVHRPWVERFLAAPPAPSHIGE
ncbi:MAG: patatin-like phospholipase family protein [Gemmatimonadetes bacterium]|nr:patatin-like phospholipase family protein [Gemmatimonadota bacterium]